MTASGGPILGLQKGERKRAKAVAIAILSAERFKMQIHLSDLLMCKTHENEISGAWEVCLRTAAQQTESS
ncbi:hypothetical protein ABH944_000426 [Caballeronia udeis]|uniref:Uncharacterized protein n=1 Tax=Caballeronia udeis TaxID=1232866 RepID=A0ABW8MD71_9BURK